MKKILALAFIAVLNYSPVANAQVRLDLPKYYIASEWAVMYGHAIDTATTQHCLGAGVCRELNPYLGRFNNPIAFTTAKIGVGIIQLYLTRRLARIENPKLAAVVNFAVTSALTSVAIHNQRLMSKH